MNLYLELEEKYNFKSDIKNSINDLLILSTAYLNGKSLYTEDKLLKVFVAEKLSGTITKKDDGVILDFSSEEDLQRRISKESKGYINRGWSYSIMHGNKVQGA